MSEPDRSKSAEECFAKILSSLRESQLEWIATQIEEETAGGQLIDTENGSVSLKDFTIEEKIVVALAIIKEYVEVPYAMWKETIKHLESHLGIKKVSIADVSKQSEKIAPFSADFPDALNLLKNLIATIVDEYELKRTELPETKRLFLEPSKTILSERLNET